MKDLFDIFDVPDKPLKDEHQYDHDPLDDDEPDCWEPFYEDWHGELEK